MKTAIELIIKERNRQIDQEGWTLEHDDEHTDQSLAMAAALYASPNNDLMIVKTCEECGGHSQVLDPWPWLDEYNYDRYNDGGYNISEHAWDKREKHDRMRRLQIAGALIVAEMERLQRAGDGEW